MSYNSSVTNSEDSYKLNMFDMQRIPSNSMHMSKASSFVSRNDFLDAERSCESDESNIAYSYQFDSMNQRELIKANGKEDQEDSVPESTDVDSEEDSYESHFDAIDELSELFDSAPVSQPSQTRSVPFARPSNPLVKDTQFCLPRFSAPAPVLSGANGLRLEVSEMNFSCPSGSSNEGLDVSSYIKPSGLVFRPVAKNNSPFTNTLVSTS